MDAIYKLVKYYIKARHSEPFGLAQDKLRVEYSIHAASGFIAPPRRMWLRYAVDDPLHTNPCIAMTAKLELFRCLYIII